MSKQSIQLLIALALPYAHAQAFDAEKLFNSTCVACHTIGDGDKQGPDLAGLSKRRKPEWIVKFMNYPQGMIEGDPEEKGYEKADPMAQKLFATYKPTIMPEQQVTAEQVQLLLKFIDAKGKQPKGKILGIK